MLRITFNRALAFFRAVNSWYLTLISVTVSVFSSELVENVLLVFYAYPWSAGISCFMQNHVLIKIFLIFDYHRMITPLWSLAYVLSLVISNKFNSALPHKAGLHSVHYCLLSLLFWEREQQYPALWSAHKLHAEVQKPQVLPFDLKFWHLNVKE